MPADRNRQKLCQKKRRKTRKLSTAILYVFPNYKTAQLGQKIRHSAAEGLLSGFLICISAQWAKASSQPVLTKPQPHMHIFRRAVDLSCCSRHSVLSIFKEMALTRNPTFMKLLRKQKAILYRHSIIIGRVPQKCRWCLGAYLGFQAPIIDVFRAIPAYIFNTLSMRKFSGSDNRIAKHHRVRSKKHRIAYMKTGHNLRIIPIHTDTGSKKSTYRKAADSNLVFIKLSPLRILSHKLNAGCYFCQWLLIPRKFVPGVFP